MMDKQIKVLQFSTHNEECGIGKYQEQFIASMEGEADLYTEYFRYSPNQTKHMTTAQFAEALNEFKQKLEGFDILHIQYEISFYDHSELAQIMGAARSMSKKIMVTVHTSPDVSYKPARLGGLSPRSMMHFLRTYRKARLFMNHYIAPLRLADLIVVHNEVTKKSLMSHGIKAESIVSIRIPVPKVTLQLKTNEIKEKLNYKNGDTIYSTVGFLSRNKGVLDAVKALSYLPETFKLAIIGGNHPNSDDFEFYDDVSDLILKRGLKDRVYITGYVADDERLNSLIRETDICVYPFNKTYYAYVSSASLNNAFANHKPVIAYRTSPFEELNVGNEVLHFCKSANYYELARELETLDIAKATERSITYAEAYAYEHEATKFMNIYRSLAAA